MINGHAFMNHRHPLAAMYKVRESMNHERGYKAYVTIKVHSTFAVAVQVCNVLYVAICVTRTSHVSPVVDQFTNAPVAAIVAHIVR